MQNPCNSLSIITLAVKINFYGDYYWEDFQKLLNDFSDAAKIPQGDY
tara:strand:+ start:26329 stop:26469 length:141 start_codon:yes stop_codon:yes gene_type:complete